MTNVLRRLAAYIPVTLTRQLLAEGLPEPGYPRTLNAATLFSDISGFTNMSEELASDGPRGAEEVNRVLMTTFTAMIDIIHRRGGAVSHFYGDAMSVYFPDENGQAARQALACAQEMQAAMEADFKQVKTSRPAGKNPEFPLTIKIGLGYGRCQEMVVGDPTDSLEFVLTGTAVDEAAAAEKQAQKGQIVASRAILDGAGFNAAADYQVVAPQPLSVIDQPILDWQTINPEHLAEIKQVITRFIPPAVHQRLTATSSANLAEHRPVTSMFIQFEYVDDEDESSAIATAVMGQQLQQYYQHVWRIVKRFGAENGRLNRVLTGDKGNQLHIMFGAPVAPDAPEQAIRCALALQREKPDFIDTQKIGLATGKVFAGPVGAASRSEYTVVGDIVNLSARLMQLCLPGRVVTNAATANRVRDLIEFNTAAPVHLKGKQIEVTPHYAQGDVATATQIQAYFNRWQKPIIGRDNETQTLLDAMNTAWSGRGQLVFITGPIGSGKTRLVAAGVRRWLTQGGEGLVGASYQHTRDIPFALWRSIWEDFFGLRPDMKPKEQANIVSKRTQALLPDQAEDVGLWGEILGLPIPQSAALAELTAEARQARFFTLARRCLQTAASTQPILIIIEDIHWADQASLKLIDEIALRLENEPILIALLFRPLDEIPLEAAQRRWTTAIELNDLSPEYARDLLQQLVGTAELPPLIEQHLGLRDRTGRDSPVNPLFLEESVNMLVSTGVLQINGRVQINDALLKNMPIPDTIHSLLLARLDRLPPHSRDVLQVASVIGREFALEPLNGITTDQTREALIPVLTGLSNEQMTQLISQDPDWIYLFQHALTHEVAYESLPYARRQELHADIAHWLEKRFADNLKPMYPILAYHYDHADIHDKCLHYALAAANAARDIFANKEAVELYTLAEKHLEALGIEEWWETAVDLLLNRSEGLKHLGDFSTALADGIKAAKLAKNRNDTYLIQAHNLMADIKYRQSDFEEVQNLTEQILQNPHATASEIARAYQWLGMAKTALGKHEEALTYLHQAQNLCYEINDLNRLARVLEAIAFVHYLQKNLTLALEAMQTSVNLSKQSSPSTHIASSLSNISLIQFQLGKPKESLETVNNAIKFAAESSPNFLARFLANRGEVLAYLGNYTQANESFEEATRLFTQMNDESGMLETCLLKAYEYHNIRCEWNESRKLLDYARQVIEKRAQSYPEAQIRLWITEIQVELNDGSIDTVKKLLTLASNGITKNERLKWWRPSVFYLHAHTFYKEKNFSEAKVAFKKALDATYDDGCPDYRSLILIGLAQLEQDSQHQLQFLTDSIDSAKERARYADIIKTYFIAGTMLIQFSTQKWQTLGYQYINEAENLYQTISQITPPQKTPKLTAWASII